MGSCICPKGQNEDEPLLIKEERKRYLPQFPNNKMDSPLLSKSPLKNKALDNTLDEKGKNTPASLLYLNEESPLIAKEDKSPPCFEQFNIKKIIGKGAYGRVLLVEKKGTGI